MAEGVLVNNDDGIAVNHQASLGGPISHVDMSKEATVIFGV